MTHAQIPQIAAYPIIPLAPNMHQRISALGKDNTQPGEKV